MALPRHAGRETATSTCSGANAAFDPAVVHFVLHLFSVTPGGLIYARRGIAPDGCPQK